MVEPGQRTGSSGRSTIDNRDRSNYSKRAHMGSLGVEHKRCPLCFHHKAFSKPEGTYCTRCKYKH